MPAFYFILVLIIYPATLYANLHMENGLNVPQRPLVYAIDASADFRHLLQQVFTCFLPDYELRLLVSSRDLTLAFGSAQRPGLVVFGSDTPAKFSSRLLKRLRGQDRWQHVPVVIMSSTGSADEVSSCYGAGANSFLVKPIDVDSMRQVIQSVCNYWFKLHQQVAVCA